MLTYPSGVSCPAGSSRWQISSISAVRSGKNSRAGAKGRSSSTTLVIAYLPILTVVMEQKLSLLFSRLGRRASQRQRLRPELRRPGYDPIEECSQIALERHRILGHWE